MFFKKRFFFAFFCLPNIQQLLLCKLQGILQHSLSPIWIIANPLLQSYFREWPEWFHHWDLVCFFLSIRRNLKYQYTSHNSMWFDQAKRSTIKESSGFKGSFTTKEERDFLFFEANIKIKVLKELITSFASKMALEP